MLNKNNIFVRYGVLERYNLQTTQGIYEVLNEMALPDKPKKGFWMLKPMGNQYYVISKVLVPW